MSATQDYFIQRIKGAIWVMSCHHVASLKLLKCTQHTSGAGRYDTGLAGQLGHLWVAGSATIVNV